MVGQCYLSCFMDPLERRDLIENEDNKINVKEDAIEGEKCNKCNECLITSKPANILKI